MVSVRCGFAKVCAVAPPDCAIKGDDKSSFGLLSHGVKPVPPPELNVLSAIERSLLQAASAGAKRKFKRRHCVKS